MPENAPLVKMSLCKKYGATVKTRGHNISDVSKQNPYFPIPLQGCRSNVVNTGRGREKCVCVCVCVGGGGVSDLKTGRDDWESVSLTLFGFVYNYNYFYNGLHLGV